MKLPASRDVAITSVLPGLSIEHSGYHRLFLASLQPSSLDAKMDAKSRRGGSRNGSLSLITLISLNNSGGCAQDRTVDPLIKNAMGAS